MKRAVTGIVLAGGASRRMGRDKGFVSYKGKTLIEYSIENIKCVCDSIIISSNKVSKYNNFNYPIIKDITDPIGPIGGIYSCLLASKTTDNLIISCDIPELYPATLDFLLSNKQDYEIVVPQHDDGHFEPLAGYYSKKIIPVLEKAITNKNYKLMDLFKQVGFKSIKISEMPHGSSQFKNVNTLEDLM
ncbi:MAG: molybdenum cofactor guanylyltransferase [Lentimicrobiaceae bacterium]|jgi:molybdopterin-guanine dinucleotide biosynthesis protein A|nr:molybdenum cofactor guanylyltransferase [Lentimicrobiaceae bacterium]